MKKVCGFGINDAPFNTSWREDGKLKHLPSYRAWHNMINRCYSGKHKTYQGCTVSDEWLNFMVFHHWWEKNYVEGYHLDKDILSPGNKVYGPDTCIYVPARINTKEGNSRKVRSGPAWKGLLSIII